MGDLVAKSETVTLVDADGTQRSGNLMQKANGNRASPGRGNGSDYDCLPYPCPDGRRYCTATNCPYTAENIHRIATRYLTQHGVGLAEAAVDGWVNSEGHQEYAQ